MADSFSDAEDAALLEAGQHNSLHKNTAMVVADNIDVTPGGLLTGTSVKRLLFFAPQNFGLFDEAALSLDEAYCLVGKTAQPLHRSLQPIHKILKL